MRLALDDFVATLKQQAAVPAAPASTADSLSPTAGYTPRPGLSSMLGSCPGLVQEHWQLLNRIAPAPCPEGATGHVE